jgi:transglutaminase-like putative cysteine protease
MPLMGMTLDAVHCDRSCAEAPNQPGDVFAATLVDAPRPLGARERGKPLRYRLLIDDQAPGALPSSPGQTADEDGRWLRVDPAGGQDRAPGPGDLGANRWLQSTHPELVALSAEFAGEGGTARQRMRRLETAVGRHIAVKSLRVGYASALDAARLGEGDCTEHALLLAALARADGIPARVATGLAYAPGFAGRESVFVPHAWVFAWTGKRWEGFDAALGGYGSGHIALETGDGDPLHFASGIELLGA